MSIPKIIDLSLFDLLRTVDNLFRTGDEDDYSLRMNKIDVSLVEFIQTFFIDFFRNGYKVEIEGVTRTDVDLVIEAFKSVPNKPQSIINLYEEAFRSIVTIKNATYHYPPKGDKLREVFDKFVPELLKSAIEEFNKLGASDLSQASKKLLSDLWQQ